MSLYKTNYARNKLSNGEMVHLYVMGNFTSPRLVDFICQSELMDAIWIDVEHFDIPTAELATLNLVANAWPVTIIARSFIGDYQTAARLLETGVGGLMCSMVNSASQAEEIVQWCKFNDPEASTDAVKGKRGWNGGNIDARYGKIPPLEYIRHQNRETLIVCQIETEMAKQNVAEIACVKGVDVLFFGPGDYAHGLGLPGQVNHPEVLAGMKCVAAAAAAAGIAWGTVATSRDAYLTAVQMGARFVCPGGDVRTMNLGLQSLKETFSASPLPVTNQALK